VLGGEHNVGEEGPYSFIGGGFSNAARRLCRARVQLAHRRQPQKCRRASSGEGITVTMYGVRAGQLGLVVNGDLVRCWRRRCRRWRKRSTPQPALTWLPRTRPPDCEPRCCCRQRTLSPRPAAVLAVQAGGGERHGDGGRQRRSHAGTRRSHAGRRRRSHAGRRRRSHAGRCRRRAVGAAQLRDELGKSTCMRDGKA
jgi:hypothetical protein